MRILLRNPVLRALVQFWWLPVLGALILGLSRGSSTLGWGGLAAYLGLLAGMLGLGWGLVRAAVARERGRHRHAGHRFLCPACLNTDEFRYACPNCEKEIQGSLALGSDFLGAACPACSHTWSQGKKGPGGLRSYCSHCRASGEREVLHERGVRIRGALFAADFDTLCACTEAAPETVAGVRCLVQDDGATKTWTLCLEDLTHDQELLPRSHVLHGLSQIWVSAGDPLRLGQIIDHLVSRAELSDNQLAGLTVCVAAPQLDPAAQRLLSNRFGSIEYGIDARRFAGPPALPESRSAGVVPAAPEVRDTAALGVGGGHGGAR